MDRVTTGIPGLDEMIEGGFIKNSSILITGGCGSGKSTFCMQFIYNGAKSGENGIYVTFEEYPDTFKRNMLRYNWNLQELEDKKKIKILRIDPKDTINLIKEDYGEIADAINEVKAKRVVIDSISSIELMIKDEFEKRQTILELISWLQKHECTSLMVSESEQEPTRYSRHGIIEFIVDGVLVMYNMRRGKARIKALEVLKMRGTNHITNLVPYVIKDGIQLLPRQVIFGEISGQSGQE